MITTVIQLITGAIGSVGFGILFHMKNKYLPLAAAGGFLSWMFFLLGKGLWGEVFQPSLLAGFIADVYAEILARICKETSTSFFVTSVIPLIPGIWTGYFSFCFWNCGRDEYCVGDLLFFQKYKEKIELTVDCKLTKSSKSPVSIANI